MGPEIRPLPETPRILVERFRLDSGRGDWDDELASLRGDGEATALTRS